MKTAQTQKEGGALTQVLKQVEQQLEFIQDDFREILRTLEREREGIVAAAIEMASGGVRVAPAEQEMMKAQITENIDEVLAEIHRAARLVGRMGTVTRNSVEIAKRAEKTWKDTLMDLLRDTKWFREHFPAAYEERRRKKEYERFRQRPELYHARPWAGEGTRAPELEEVRPRAHFRSKIKTAQLESISAAVGALLRRLFELVQSYFTTDSPILQASNQIVGRIQKKMGKRINEAVARGLKDQLQVLENLFGFERQPGRFITSGARAFLLPAAKQLRDALETLQNPLKDVEEFQTFTEELGQRFQQPAAPTAPATPGQALTSRKSRVLERFSRLIERQKRCNFIQRVASSR